MKSAGPLCLAAVMALAGCAPKLVPPPVVNIEAMSCTAAMATESAAPLLFDPKGEDEKTTPLVLDARSKCLQEADGSRRLYQVYTLPDLGAPYIIGVRTSPWAETLLAPRLLLLGSDGKIIRSTTHDDFVFRGEQLSALLRSHSDESYLAVTSDSEVLGKEITRVIEAVHSTAVATGAGGVFMWYSGTDHTNRMVLSVAGRAEISITPYPSQDKKK